MFSLKCVILLTLALYLVYLTDETEGMGICFGGYPACCSGGKNTCGPFCASCRRVPEFLRNMMMFDMLGFGKGSPEVFRIINPDPHAFPDKDPFPAQPEHVGLPDVLDSQDWAFQRLDIKIGFSNNPVPL